MKEISVIKRVPCPMISGQQMSYSGCLSCKHSRGADLMRGTVCCAFDEKEGQS